jgi:hypothetical protein
VLTAVAELTFRPADAPVPEAGVHDAETALAADPLEELRMLAEHLLDGADERDLTEEFLVRPWPFPAIILANLTILAGLDASYGLSYPGHLALREAGTSTRVATRVILRRSLFPRRISRSRMEARSDVTGRHGCQRSRCHLPGYARPAGCPQAPCPSRRRKIGPPRRDCRS